MIKRILLLALLLPLCSSLLPAVQETVPRGQQAAEKRKSNLERWQKLSPEKKARFRRLFKSLQTLSPQRREAIKKRLRALGPKKRHSVLRHHHRLHGADPKKRDDLRRRHESLLRWRWHLPEEEQKRLRNLPPEEHRAAIRSRIEEIRSGLLSGLPPGERERIEGLPRREQVEHLRKLLPPPPHPPRVVFRVMRELRGLPREQVRLWLQDPRAATDDPRFSDSLRELVNSLDDGQIQEVRKALQRDRKRSRARGGPHLREPRKSGGDSNRLDDGNQRGERQRPGRGRGVRGDDDRRPGGPNRGHGHNFRAGRVQF